MSVLRYGLTAALAFALGAVTFMSDGLLAKANIDTVSYKPVNFSEWPVQSSSSALTLLEPIVGDFPTRLEGRPGLKIDLTKRDGVIIGIVERTGYLDDSVEGSRVRAEITRRGEAWTLSSVGSAHRCYRAFTFGWTTKPCP